MAEKFKIKRGDQVIVRVGRDKGKTGEVIKVDRARRRVVVRDVNMVKRHLKASQRGPGGIEEKEASLHISNVAIVDPAGGKASRVGYKLLKDGTKVRYAKASGEVLDR